MKKLFIILAFLPLLGIGQIKELQVGGKILVFQGQSIETRVYNQDAQALFNRMSVSPTEDRKILISHVIDLLQEYGIWDSLDVLQIYAAHDIQATLLNWIGDYNNAALVNSPTFAVDSGITGNGSNAYINANYNPSTDAINYKLNSSSIGVYNRTNVLTRNFLCGVTAGGGVSNLQILTSSTLFSVQLNSSNITYYNYDDNTQGFIQQIRTDTSTVNFYQNILKTSSSTRYSSAIPSGDFYVLASNGVGAYYSSNEVSCFYAGGGLSDFQAYMFNYIIDYYMSQLNASSGYGDYTNPGGYYAYLDNFYETTAPSVNVAVELNHLTTVNDGWRNSDLQNIFAKFNASSYTFTTTLNQKQYKAIIDDTAFVAVNTTYTWDSIYDDYDYEALTGPFDYYLEPTLDFNPNLYVTFIDDDGLTESWQRTRPVFEALEKDVIYSMIMQPTDYDTFPTGWMQADQTDSITNYYGSMISNHSATHIPATDPSFDFNTEYVASFNKLKRMGYDTTMVVYPGGISTHELRQSIVDYCNQAVGVTGTISTQNYPPINTYDLARVLIDDGVDLDSLKTIVDSANTHKFWLIFYYHAQDSYWSNEGSEPGYPSSWVVPSSPIPSGWRPQLGTKLHDLYALIQYIGDVGGNVVDSKVAYEYYNNITQVGDFSTKDLFTPYYVVGKDSTIIFRRQ